MNHMWLTVGKLCTHYAYKYYHPTDRASCAMLKIEIVTRNNEVTHDRSKKLTEALSLSLSLSLPSPLLVMVPREFAKFSRQLQLQLCGLKLYGGETLDPIGSTCALRNPPATAIWNLLQASSSSSSPYAWRPCRYRSTSCWMRRCACSATLTWTKSYCTPWSGTRTATNFIAIHPETRPWC